jgi:hypothetical protein
MTMRVRRSSLSSRKVAAAVRMGVVQQLSWIVLPRPVRFLAANRILPHRDFPHQGGQVSQQAGSFHGVMPAGPLRHAACALDRTIGFQVPVGFRIGYSFPHAASPAMIVPSNSCWKVVGSGSDTEQTRVWIGVFSVEFQIAKIRVSACAHTKTTTRPRRTIED